MKLSKSYNYNFKGTNTEMLITVFYDQEFKEVEEIESIEIVVNNKTVADITSIIHDFFDEIEDKIFEDECWHELAAETKYMNAEN